MGQQGMPKLEHEAAISPPAPRNFRNWASGTKGPGQAAGRVKCSPLSCPTVLMTTSSLAGTPSRVAPRLKKAPAATRPLPRGGMGQGMRVALSAIKRDRTPGCDRHLLSLDFRLLDLQELNERTGNVHENKGEESRCSKVEESNARGGPSGQPGLGCELLDSRISTS
jgi:hypothetical protein